MFLEGRREIQKASGSEIYFCGVYGRSFGKPTYEDVCTDKSGHAEVVQMKYDPSEITYEELLDVFWKTHNPTTRNRQGPDIGTQY